jgi:hypothetical protein
MLEGVDNMNIEGTMIMKPSIDAIQEFQIQTSNYSAEFGRSAGGIVQVQLRSGTNGYHGSLFEFFRNDKLDANGFFNNQVPADPRNGKAPRSALRRNQFGFTFGGPLIKDKLFFFGDYQGSRQRQGRSEVFTVPTLAERQGDFRDSLPEGTPIYKNALTEELYPGCDPANFTPERCQVIPRSAMDPAALKVLDLYPAPNVPGVVRPGTGIFNNYSASAASQDNSNSLDIKIDHRINDKNSLTGHYSFGKANSTVPAAFGNGTIGPCIDCGLSLNLLAGRNEFTNQIGGVTYIRGITPGIFNELRVGVNRTYNPYLASDGGADLANQAGIPNVNVNNYTTGLPWFSFSPSPQWIGTSPFLPFFRAGTAYQLTDNLSLVRGRHRLKTGVDIRRRLDNNFSNFFPRAGYIFNPFFTGNALGDFLTGRPIVILQDLLEGTLGIRGMEYGFYVQDDLHVSPTLTLNLGIRYELFPGYVEQYDRNANLDLERGVALLAGRDGLPRSFVATDKNNWAPRFGFAWSPWGSRTVIRGGYGISYFNANNYFSFNTVNPPYTASLFVFNLNESADAIYRISDGIPVDQRPTPATFDPAHPSGSWRVLDPNQRSPYTQFFSFGVQRALPWSTVLDVAYVGSRGLKLPGSYEANPAPPGDPSNLDARRIRHAVMPDVTTVTYYTNGFASAYHSLQAKLEKRFSHGLQLLSTYTWSKSMDDISGSPLTGGGDSNPSGTIQNPFDFRADRARSSFDRTHRFVLAANYELPIGRGKAFGASWHPAANLLLGNWQLNGVVTVSTGLPFSVFASGNTQCGCSAGDMRADRLRDGNLPADQRSPEHWFDSSAFADPPGTELDAKGNVISAGRYGNSGRNIIKGPGFSNVDFSIFKKFAVRETSEVQFRAEAFNLFNHVNFFYPSSTQNASWQSGGLITRAYPPRIIQLALKFVF